MSTRRMKQCPDSEGPVIKDPMHEVFEPPRENGGYETDLSKTKLEISWGRIFFLSLLHAGTIYGLLFIRSGISGKTEIFFKTSVVFNGLGLTLGHHRLWSHKSYKASRSLQILLAIAASGAIQYSIYDWARDHRMHHKYSETNADPHNPSRGFFYAHIGWLLCKKQKDVRERGKEMDYSDLENNPVVMFQHKYYPLCIGVFSIFLPIFIPWYFWGETVEGAFFICFLYKQIVNLHAAFSINSFAHSVGYKTYNRKIGPTDNPFGWISTLGEGFHNFHHVFPSDYRSGEFSNDTRNISAQLIDMFHKFGMATDLKSAPKSVVQIWVKEHGDHSNDGNKYLGKVLSKSAQDSITQIQYLILQLLFFYYL